MAGKTVTDVVHSEARKSGSGMTHAKVVLADGRVGEGTDFHWFSKGGGDAEAVSNAIQDARSKPVPKK